MQSGSENCVTSALNCVTAALYQFVYLTDWRAYWILAPGALLIGLAGQVLPLLLAVVFATVLIGLRIVGWREIGLLTLSVAVGWCIDSSIVTGVRTVDGTVSLVSGNCVYLTDAGGRMLKIFTHDPQLPGARIRARVRVDYRPIHPADCVTTPSLRLVQYLKIGSGEAGLRQKIYDTLHAKLSADSAGIASLLVLGAGKVSDELRRSFVDAGLSHLLAISGLHVSLVCGTAWCLLRRIFALTSTRMLEPIALGIATCVGLVYAVIAGCGIPLLRALSMFCAGGAAWCAGRTVDLARLCGFVACVMLCAYPDQWYAPSFVLSFLATASLITRPRSLFVVSLPYTLYFFFQSSMQPFLANLLGIAWLSVAVMPCLLSALALWSLGCDVLFAPLDLAIQVLVMIARNPLSYTLHIGYQDTIWILLWTFSVFAFFLVQQYRALAPGLVCVGIGLLRAVPHEPIALRHGGVFGLWDSEVLWVSERDAWVVGRWQDILGGVSVQEIPTCKDGAWIATQDGYLWTRSGDAVVWLGKTATCPAVAAHATIKLLKYRKHCYQIDNNCIAGDIVWVWLKRQQVWRSDSNQIKG